MIQNPHINAVIPIGIQPILVKKKQINLRTRYCQVEYQGCTLIKEHQENSEEAAAVYGIQRFLCVSELNRCANDFKSISGNIRYSDDEQ